MATLATLALLGVSALYAISNPKLPSRQQAAPEPDSCDGTNAVCAGRTWETLICDSSIKVSKCFDAKLTCHSWNVCDCCSAVPLHKCLLPMAGRAFDVDCSSPIDAREECCGDAVTHLRAFQGLADLQEGVKDGVQTATAKAQSAAASAEAAASSAVNKAKDLVN